jgi:hypothetical protein
MVLHSTGKMPVGLTARMAVLLPQARGSSPLQMLALLPLLKTRFTVIPSAVEESLTIFSSMGLRSLDFARDDKWGEIGLRGKGRRRAFITV